MSETIVNVSFPVAYARTDGNTIITYAYTFTVWECAASFNVTLYAGELRPLLLVLQAKCLNPLFHHLLHTIQACMRTIILYKMPYKELIETLIFGASLLKVL